MRDTVDTDTAPQAAELLDWYDVHARRLPWRVPPHDSQRGVRPDPYHIWMSEIMLQQTTVAAVGPYFHKFLERWPRVQDLAAAADEDVMAAWAGLGYYARARNLLKCARHVTDELGGQFPDEESELLKLPGVGPYTAAAVAAIAFGRPATVLDGNVERVMSRLHRVAEPLPDAKPVLRDFASRLTPQQRAGDYAQAVMDLGATICTPKSPACGICPWMPGCEARSEGDAASYPRKKPKPAKPIRYGVAYVVRRGDGALLLERRAEKGLLGGMLGWPGSDWTEATPGEAPPLSARWTEVPTEVRHTFTHFHLRLTVRIANVRRGERPDRGRFMPASQFDEKALPTVMRKVWKLAATQLIS